MDSNISLNISKDDAKKFIKEKITYLEGLIEINDIKVAFNNIISEMKEILYSKEIFDELEVKIMYQENIYSKDRTKNNIFLARERVVKYLNEILLDINKDLKNDDKITEDIAIVIIKKILNNFYKHIEVMYENPVHKTAGITKDKLNEIKIINEYDVQRILYSLIKPVFPNARTEVSNDTGFSTMRYDISIDEFSIVIEVKCSRKSMTEKKLTEEIGSDIFHYKYKNIFFFIYDKEKIIKNIDAFTNVYNINFDSKKINTVAIQPISL